MLSCSVPNQTLITAWYRIDLKDSKRFAPTDVESIQMASRDLVGRLLRYGRPYAQKVMPLKIYQNNDILGR